MEFILTSKTQCSKKCKDGKKRNFLLYFLNNTLILRQKFPYDDQYDKGFDKRTLIMGEYLLNGKLYQIRQHWLGCGLHDAGVHTKARHVSYPISRKRLEELQVPKDLVIHINE